MLAEVGVRAQVGAEVGGGGAVTVRVTDRVIDPPLPVHARVYVVV